MELETWIPVVVVVAVVGLIALFVLGRSRGARATEPALAPVAPAEREPPVDEALAAPAPPPAAPSPAAPAVKAEPLAFAPVTADPMDVPEPNHVGDPTPPGLEVAPKPVDPAERATLREHHRSPSGHLRILFAKEMRPADTDETDPGDA